MPWTYSGDPSVSTRDLVRFLLGDTDESDPLLQDGEIDYLVSSCPEPLFAAADGADALAARFTRQITKSVGALSISAGERARQFRDLSAALRQRAYARGLDIYAGGRSISAKVTAETQTDDVQPSFKVGMDDYPGTATVSPTRTYRTGGDP